MRPWNTTTSTIRVTRRAVATRARKDTEMQKHSLIAIAVALFTAGCTMAPKYERPAPPVSATFPTGGVYATQPVPPAGARSARGQAASDIGWRDFFIDARMQRLIELALKNNRDLRVSVLNIDAARAQYQVTRAALFPSVTATASENRTRTPTNLSLTSQTITTSYQVGLSTSWELDFWGRVRSLKDQALAQYLATAQARKAAEISLVAAVAEQYLSVLAFDDLQKVTQDTLKTAQDSYEITKVEFDTGTGTELDLRQAETVVEQAMANLQAEARQRAQAVNALVLLVGEPLPADLPPGLLLGDQDLLTDIPEGLPSDLLTRRPDIMEAEQSLLAANANIGAARAAFFPQISLTAAFGTASPTLGSLFKAGSAAWSFAPQIAQPDLRRRREHRESRSGARAEEHPDCPVRKGDPDGVSRSRRRSRGPWHVRSGDPRARAQPVRRATPARVVGPALQERRGQLSDGVDRPDRSVYRAAVADQCAFAAADEPGRPCTSRWVAAGSSGPATHRVRPMRPWITARRGRRQRLRRRRRGRPADVGTILRAEPKPGGFFLAARPVGFVGNLPVRRS